MDDAICTVPGCGRTQHRFGDLCKQHYERKRRGEPDWDRPVRHRSPNTGSCTAAGCTDTTHVRGLCKRHHDQARKEALHAEREERHDPVWILLAGLGTQVENALRDPLDRLGLTPLRLRVLRMTGREEANATQISRIAGTSLRTIQVVISRLIEDGLLSPPPPARPGKPTIYTLTPLGSNILAAAETAVADIEDRLGNALGADGRIAILRLSATLNAIVDKTGGADT
jgi:DNA-binding MarR family transcriptional regulator